MRWINFTSTTRCELAAPCSTSRPSSNTTFEVRARSHGAEIRVNAPVAQVIVKNGAAIGVALEKGDEIYANTVVSGCDPKVSTVADGSG